MKKYMYLCPECHKLVEELKVLYKEYTWYLARPIDDLSDFERDWIDESEFIESLCPHCGTVFSIYPDDLIVLITDDGMIEPVGMYWSDRREEFDRAVSEILMS